MPSFQTVVDTQHFWGRKERLRNPRQIARKKLEKPNSMAVAAIDNALKRLPRILYLFRGSSGSTIKRQCYCRQSFHEDYHASAVQRKTMGDYASGTPSSHDDGLRSHLGRDVEAANSPGCSWIDFTGILNISLFVSIAYNQTPDIIVGNGSQQRIPIKINKIFFGGEKKNAIVFFPKPKNAQINGGRSGRSFHRRIFCAEPAVPRQN